MKSVNHLFPQAKRNPDRYFANDRLLTSAVSALLEEAESNCEAETPEFGEFIYKLVNDTRQLIKEYREDLIIFEDVINVFEASVRRAYSTPEFGEETAAFYETLVDGFQDELVGI